MKFLLSIYFFIFTASLFAQVPSLVFPKNGQVLEDTLVNFQWDDVPGATSYRFQLSTDSLFQTFQVDTNNLNSNSYGPLNLTLSQSPYFFRVLYSKQSISSSFSTISKFYCFNPKVIDSLSLWLTSNIGITKDINNKISNWTDNHTGINSFQATLVSKPTFLIDSTLAKPYVFFDGNDYLIIDSNVRISSAFAVTNYKNGSTFTTYAGLVARQTYAPAIRGIFVGTSGSNIIWNPASATLFANNILINSVATINFNPLVKTKILEGHSNTGNVFKLFIGRYVSEAQSWKGDLFELLTFSQVLTNSEKVIVRNYLLHKYTPPVNIGPNILRRYGFCDTLLRTEKQYFSYLWSTGDTTREITVAKEDTGWYWCQVPNLYGQMMRDSVYVYNLLPKQDLQDTTLCYGDTLTLTSTLISGYTHLWQDISSGDTLSQSPSLQLAPSHPRPILLSVNDTLGCFITDTFHLEVDSFPVLASLGPDKSVCSGDKIGLVVGNNEADSFLWNTGSTDSLLVIQTAGTYSLSTLNARGCFAKDTIQVVLHGITPYVAFSAAPVCFNDSTLFIDSSMSLDQSNLISWNWEYGDGKTFYTPVPSSPRTLYDSSGLYTAKLTVSTDSGCTNYAFGQVLVRPLPQPKFMPLTSCQNHNVQLQNLSTHSDSIVSYRWIFNQSDTLFANAPLRQFADAGIQSIQLTPYDLHGCQQSVSKDFEVRPSPLADFNYSTQCKWQEVFFSDYSTASAINPIQSHMWEFNVGSPFSGQSNLQSPSFLFPGAGIFPVKLQANTLNGCWDTVTLQIKVHDYPQASFINDTACQGHEFLFYNQSTLMNDSIKESQWDFGDGNAVLHLAGTPSPNLPYRYEDTLTHKVTLIMVSQALCTDTVVRYVNVHHNPHPQFSMSRQYGLPPLEVAFTNQSIGIAPLQSIWTFGDGAQSTQFHASHQYLDSAIFYPQLQITDAIGCWDTLRQPLYVIYAAIDVALSEVRMVAQNQKMKFSCSIRNQGKQPVNRLQLSASYPGSFALVEEWEGTLTPGSDIDYEFKALMALKEGETMPPYFCISAQLPDDAPQADERPENNILCKDINSSYWVGEPYPNPINDQFKLDLILEYSKDCEIKLLDSQGIHIQTYLQRGVKGLNQWQFTLPNLQSGIYYLQIKVPEEEIQLRKVVVF